MLTPCGDPFLLLLLLLLLPLVLSRLPDTKTVANPTPAPWPEQFHALLYTNLSSAKLRVDDLWYDWPNGRNLFIMQQQLSDVIYDVEWDNGTSFYYTLGTGGTCRTIRFPVGIVRPDFLQLGSVYLGRVHTDGFLCDVWQKLEFIWYYEDVATRRPVRWDFYDGISMHVMTFEVGAVLNGPQWQAPAYCFDGDGDGDGDSDSRERRGSSGGGGEDKGEAPTWRGFADVHRRLRFLDQRGDPPVHHLHRTAQLGHVM